MRWASSGGAQTGQVNCLAGERATGGGYGVAATSSLRFTSSTPHLMSIGATPTGWSVTATTADFFSIYVVCAAP